jgi:hypothetical protein
MDIAFNRYYKKAPVDGPNANSNIAHPYTALFLSVLNTQFPQEEDADLDKKYPCAYFEVISQTMAVCDQITKSWLNVPNASLALHLIEKFVAAGIPASDIGVVTPYSAQVQVLKYGVSQLHNEQPSKGYDRVFIDTTDSFQGSERAIIICDTVVTDSVGFVNFALRILVMTTRACDGFVFIGRPSRVTCGSLAEIEIVELFEMAKKRDVYRELKDTHEALNHRFAESRIRLI